MLKPMNYDSLQKWADTQQKKYNHAGLASKFAKSDVTYPYILGITSKGKTVIWGPFSENEVDEQGKKLLDAEVFYCDTIDLSEATRQIKAELLRRGDDPDEALSRKGHSVEESAKGREEKEKNKLSHMFHFLRKKPQMPHQ
jgi:hypothetical protein